MLLKRSTIVLVLLVLLMGIAAASASAAKADSEKKSSSDLIIRPASPSEVDSFNQFSTMSISSVYTIKQGQTNWHSKYIPPGCPGYYADLNWGNSANSLQLRIYAANGRLYGPYYDSSDGRIDGRILLWITSGSGTIPSGTYYHEVYGYRVSGVEDYTF